MSATGRNAPMRSILITLGIALSTSAIAASDAENERNRLDQKLCTARTLEQVVAASEAVKLPYFIDTDRTALTARRDFNQEKLVSSSVIVEIQFRPDKTVRACKVRVLHTAP